MRVSGRDSLPVALPAAGSRPAWEKMLKMLISTGPHPVSILSIFSGLTPGNLSRAGSCPAPSLALCPDRQHGVLMAGTIAPITSGLARPRPPPD